MHKKKSAVNHRRWFSADCLSIPFSESTAHVPFVLVQNTSQRASTIGDGSPLTVNYSLLKCTTHVPFVLVQNTSQRSSTIDDGLCLRSLNYSLLRCTTHVPFVLVQNTSQRFSPLVSSQPSHLWLSAVRRSPACLPAPTAEKEIKKKNSTHFPSMAVCCATLFSPTKGKSTWGVEI